MTRPRSTAEPPVTSSKAFGSLLTAVLVAALALGLGEVPATADPGLPAPGARRTPSTDDLYRGGDPVRVGSLTLRPCRVMARALCGHLERLWEPDNAAAGTLRVGFAYVPARVSSRAVLGTLVPREGGPGYSTTGTAWWYAQMYGPLLDRRNLLLMDQRGTGLSEPIDCPDLQDLKIRYAVAAGRCGRSLGARSDDYSTARSADDLAALIDALELDRVDVYGDSYGTFFAQVFAGRHPQLLRSLILDGAYPTYGENGWYPTQGPAMRQSFARVCRRSVACRTAGRAFLPTMRRVLRQVRSHPWRGASYDGDGHRIRVEVTARTLTSVAFSATYTPATYRELTAALRSGLAGDRSPLLRLVAQAEGGATDAGPVRDYSEGLDAAVACHDYPQVYDVAVAPATRVRQYRRALARRSRLHPGTYRPFTVREYARSSWQALDWCLRWPSAPADNPAHPPRPRGGYPEVPTLVLSGELDSITTPAEGALVSGQFPRARQIVVANSFHVTALADTDGCAKSLVRRFVARPSTWPDATCAGRVPPVRAIGRFPVSLAEVRPGAGHGTRFARRVAPGAAATVTDLVDQWWSNYSGHSDGLRGGHWTYSGDRRTVFRLRDVRLTADLAVSGKAVWWRYRNRIKVSLHVRAHGRRGELRGSWRTRDPDSLAVLHGRFAGRPVSVRFPAP